MHQTSALICPRGDLSPGDSTQPGETSGETRLRNTTLRRLWLPDLALLLAFVTLIFCLSLFDGWHQLFRDSDTGWHIRTGESILTNGGLPGTDPYSFTRSGAPWLDWEWAADVATGLAHRAGGPAGVAALFAAAIAVCTWLWIRLQFAVGGDFLLACLFAAPMLSTVNLHWLARPHVFGWVLTLGCLLMLERRRGAVWFFILGVVWANVHGSFFLGPLLAGLYALGAAARQLIWDPAPREFPANNVVACIAMTAGTLVNPYGWNLHRHVASYLADSELLSRIGEFQTFNFQAAGTTQILIAFALAAAGTIAAFSQRRLEHFLTGSLFLLVGLRSARGLPLVALAVLPLANGALTETLRRARGLAPRLRTAIQQALDYSDRLRALDRGLAGWILILPAALLLMVAAHSASAGFPPDQFPVKAAAAVSVLPPDARLLAPDKFGGYLIYRFNGSRKVFFDGRSDFYGTHFMKDYIRLVEARPGWREQVAQFGFTHALLPNNYSLIPGLEQAGWRRLYQDETATLLAAPGH